MGIVKEIAEVLRWPVRWAVKHLVEREAQSIAVKQAATRIAIRMHVDQYVHLGRISADEARGKSARIFDLLAKEIASEELDPDNEAVLQRIKDQVTMSCVPLSAWVVLSAIPPKGTGAVEQIGIVYRGPRGEETHTSVVLAHLQRDFLFHKPFIWSGGNATEPPEIEVSPDVAAMMRQVLDQQKISILRVQVGPVGSVGMDFLGHLGHSGTGMDSHA